MSQNPRNDLDTLIDDVAREMTDGAPRSGLEGRVAARIAEAGSGSSSRPWMRAWILAPAAAAAVVVLAVVVVRETKPPVTPNRTQATQQGRIQPGRTTPEAAATAGPGTVPAAGIGRRPDRDVAPSATNVATRTLATVDPDPAPPILQAIEVDRVEMSPLARGDAIEIDPIAIERIDITAMP